MGIPVISISSLASKSTLYLTEKTARTDDHMNTSEILICISAGKDNLWLGLLGFHSIPFGLDDYSNERAK